jgi:outer membrane biosynthesis protein TonB
MIKSKMVQITRLFTLCFAFLIIISLAIPAHADVTSLKTDKTLYKKNVDTTMTFTGTAEEEDINEIVTIVIYDPGTNFVKPAKSGIVSSGKTFEIKISEKDFSKISSHGTYNATAFMSDQQRVDGISITFDYSVDGNPIHPTTQPAPTPQPTPTPTPSPTTTTPQPEDDSGKSIQDRIQERIEAAKKQQSQTTDSTEKSIEDKIKERIEAAKNQGTKTNTTDSTGGDKPVDGTIPKEKPDNTGANNPVSLEANILFIALGIGAAAAVGVAVYTMKLKPKFLAREVSDNVSTDQQHSDSSPQEEDYSLMILKNRLAKGEITVGEFNELKRALTES